MPQLEHFPTSWLPKSRVGREADLKTYLRVLLHFLLENKLTLTIPVALTSTAILSAFTFAALGHLLFAFYRVFFSKLENSIS
jgi:hypothetical protein